MKGRGERQREGEEARKEREKKKPSKFAKKEMFHFPTSLHACAACVCVCESVCVLECVRESMCVCACIALANSLDNCCPVDKLLSATRRSGNKLLYLSPFYLPSPPQPALFLLLKNL